MSALRQRVILFAKLAVAALFAGIALNVLAHEFASTSVAEITAGLGSIGWSAAGLATLATLAAFAAVGTYDAFALHYIGKKLSLARSELAAGSTYAISNLLGFPVFTGNAVRFWLYRGWDLGAGDVAAAAIVTTVICNVMMAMIAGASLIASPGAFQLALGLSTGWSMALGATLLIAGLVLTGLGIVGPKRISLWRLTFNRPGLVLIPHLVACIVDYAATASVLYVLLGDAVQMNALPFIALVSTAKLIGIVSNVPGGLGVFEAMLAGTLHISPAPLASALIAYRCIFYLAPFAVASAVLAGHVLLRASRRISPRQPSHPPTQLGE